jgi:chromosomal replication initiation ATPase DnaA
LRIKTGLSLAEIGKTINRHHTTVIHSIQKIEDLIVYKNPPYMYDIYKKLDAIFEDLTEKIR